MEADYMQRITEEQIRALEAQYGRVRLVVFNGNEMIFRKPKRTEIKRHRILMHSENAEERASADEALAQMMIVHVNGKEGKNGEHARQAFLDLLEELPYLASCKDVTKTIGILSGTTQDTEGKDSAPASPPNGKTPKNSHAV